MNKLSILLVIFSIFFVTFVFSQESVNQFTADLFITNDPNQNKGSGVTVNKLYYDFVNKVMRLDYPKLKDPKDKTGKTVVKEIYDYGNKIVTQLCQECSAYKNTVPQPIYFRQSTDTLDTSKNFEHSQLGVCQAFNKANPSTAGEIRTVWVNGQGMPCRVQRTDGTMLNFSNVTASAPDKSVFIIPENANCPKQPKCAAPIDLVIVADQSGSIKRDEWKLFLEFGNAVINSFEIGPTQTQIGLVFFSGVDYQNDQDPASCCGLSAPVLPLSFDKQTILKFFNNHRQTGGHTCINCGMNSATTYEPNPNRAVQAPKVMIVITDGYNNRMVNFFIPDVRRAKSLGWKIFSVGVRQADRAELAAIATEPTKDHLFYVEDFSLLKAIRGTLVDNVCAEFPFLTPCGPLCKGKCTCGGQCLCPDTCDTGGDKCATGECVFNESGSGCRIVKTVCDPGSTNGDRCKDNVCNPETGKCEIKTKSCTAADLCTEATCDPKVGCVYKDKCDAKIKTPGTEIDSQCLKRKCDKGVCSSEQIECKPASKCEKSSCDPRLGCVKSPINCEDGNKCTINVCDPKVGCKVEKEIECPPKGFFESQEYLSNKEKYACATFRCQPDVGCVTTPKTCDDNNICTKDSCDPKTGNCINTPITCPNPDPTNNCISFKCDPKLGCQQQEKNCDDGNPCTKDSCDKATGNCVNEKIECQQSAAQCATMECDPAVGKCVPKDPVTCPQGEDKCQSAKCNPATKQCDISTRLCNPPDKCVTTSCDPKVGCISTPITCDDKNVCTKDTCDPVNGCVYTPIPGCDNTTVVCENCVSTDPCNPKVCENGKCETKPVTCEGSNKCVKLVPQVVNDKCECKVDGTPVVCPNPTGTDCGEGVCDPATGECTSNADRVCGNEDPCVKSKCELVDNKPKCTFTSAITCQGDSACSRKKCVPEAGKPKCVDDPDSGNKCDDASECTTAKCDPTTGKCIYEEKKCDTTTDLCVAKKCDPETRKCVENTGINCPQVDLLKCGKNGKCVTIDEKPTCTFDALCPRNESSCLFANCTNGDCKSFSVNCDDGDPCTTDDKCIPLGFEENGKPLTRCEYTPFTCEPSKSPCKVNKCVNEDGKPKCVETDVTCDDGNNCTKGACDPQTGKCVFTEIDCGEGDVCSVFTCLPDKGCVKQNKCNDSDICTNDLCDPKTGKCTFTPLNCTSPDPCKVGKCDENAGCVFVPIDCATDPKINSTIDACHFPVCDPVKGCVLNVVPNTLDACGKCTNETDNSCRVSNGTAIPVAATAGAVVGAAVVVGAAAVGLGIFLAKGAADSFAGGSDDAIVGANTNPLYAEGGNEGVNPFHNQEGSNTDYQALN